MNFAATPLVRPARQNRHATQAISDMKTVKRFLSSVTKGNLEILDLPAGDVDHLLAKFFSTEQIL